MKRFVLESQWLKKHYGEPALGYERRVEWDGEIVEFTTFGRPHHARVLGVMPEGLTVVDAYPLDRARFISSEADTALLKEHLREFSHWQRRCRALLDSEKETSDDHA